MAIATRAGRHIHYRVSGNGKEAILFQNSLGTALGMWDAQAEALGDGYTIIGMDWPGHGDSELVPEGPADIDTLVDDGLAVLDAVGVPKAHVVGLSLGGLTAQATAIVHPGRVRSLTLCATASVFSPPDLWLNRAATVLQTGMEPMVAASRDRWFAKGFADRDLGEAERLLAMLHNVKPLGYAFCCEVLARTDLTDRIGQISAPTLLISGADDPATPPARLAEIECRLPGSRHVSLSGAAHILNVEKPAEVAALIRAHVESGR